MPALLSITRHCIPLASSTSNNQTNQVPLFVYRLFCSANNNLQHNQKPGLPFVSPGFKHTDPNTLTLRAWKCAHQIQAQSDTQARFPTVCQGSITTFWFIVRLSIFHWSEGGVIQVVSKLILQTNTNILGWKWMFSNFKLLLLDPGTKVTVVTTIFCS